MSVPAPGSWVQIVTEFRTYTGMVQPAKGGFIEVDYGLFSEADFAADVPLRWEYVAKPSWADAIRDDEQVIRVLARSSLRLRRLQIMVRALRTALGDPELGDARRCSCNACDLCQAYAFADTAEREDWPELATGREG